MVGLQLTSREIQKLYKDLLENGRLRKKQRKKHPGLSGSTVRGVHIMLHGALDRAVKERLLVRNPADGCVVPKVQHQEMKTLQPEDLKAYLDAAERRNSLAMFYLELVSGIRKGELVALQWADLNVAEKTISVSKQAVKDETGNLVVTRPKTENSVRQISIPQEAVDLLVREHAKHPDNPWLFPSSRTGVMYHPDSVATLHQRILKDAGLEHLRFYDLRHTFATLALQNGVESRLSPPCWATTTPGSPSAPTPTPPARSKTRRPRPWATSWRRYGKTHLQKAAQRTGWEAELPRRCAAFFRPYPKGMSWQ